MGAKKKKGKRKSPQAVVKGRVDVIFKMLLQGFMRHDILQYVADSTDWNVKSRQVDNYIQKANEVFRKESDACSKREFGKAISRLNRLYQKSYVLEDYKSCLAIQREINVLAGIHRAAKPTEEEQEGFGESKFVD